MFRRFANLRSVPCVPFRVFRVAEKLNQFALGSGAPRLADKLSPRKVETPELKTPELKTPELKTPELKTPALQTPTLKTPVLKTPALKTQSKAQAPELEWTDLPVQSQGKTA